MVSRSVGVLYQAVNAPHSKRSRRRASSMGREFDPWCETKISLLNPA